MGKYLRQNHLLIIKRTVDLSFITPIIRRNDNMLNKIYALKKEA